MTKDEALKLALEALEKDVRFYKTQKLAAITAIKQALAAPVQEPVAVVKVLPLGDGHKPMHWADWTDADNPPPEGTLLHTAAQRQWVGLTNQERSECWETIPELAMKKVEAKLKEKNT